MSSFDPAVLASHVDFVRRLARGLVRGPGSIDEADDVAAEALAAAVVQRPETGASFRGWLRRVVPRLARRRAVADERRNAREQFAVRDEHVGRAGLELGADQVAAQIEIERQVALAFTSLEEPTRSTLFRRYWLDLTPTQIAAETATPIATVKSRLQRGLEQLRERLDAAHRGRREEWLAALAPWVSVASGVAVGGTVVAMKSKIASIAVAAMLVAGASIGLIATSRKAARDADVATTSEMAAAARALDAASGATDDGQASADDRAQAIAQRTVDPAALPFAAGVVVDGTGAPIADVAVVLRPMGRYQDPAARNEWRNSDVGFRRDLLERHTLATSDASGRFRVARPDESFVGFWFVRDGFGLGEWLDLAADPAANQKLRVVLAPARPVRGIVRDREGRPVPGAIVAIRPRGEQEPEPMTRVARHLAGAPEYLTYPQVVGVQHGRSGADGRFELACVPDGRYRGSAHATGHARAEIDDLPDPWEPVLTRCDLVLDVVDADTRQPIDCACAIVVGRKSGVVQQVAYAATAFVGAEERRIAGLLTISVSHPRGGLTWLLIAPDQTVDATIHVAAVGYDTATIDTPITAKVEPPRLRVELAPDAKREREPSLAGRVVGPPDAEVELYAVQAAVHGIDPGDLLHYAPHLQTRCSADGSFAFPPLPNADYLLVAKAKGCAPVRVDVTAPRRDLVLTLDTAVSLEVIVTNRDKAVADATVLVQDESGKNAWSKSTDASGVARFEALPMGTLRALAVAGDETPRSHFPDRGRAAPLSSSLFDDTEVIEAAAGASLRLELHPVERRPVRLQFRRDDGTAVTQLQFEYCGASAGVGDLVATENETLHKLASDVDTDASGDAIVDLYPGEYWFLAIEGRIRESTKVEVPRDGPASATFRLPDVRPFGTLSGRVVELGSGAPIVGRDLKVYAMRPNGSSNTAGTATTDGEGRYTIPNVPCGDVVVEAMAHLFGGKEGDGRPDPDSEYGSAVHQTKVEADRETTVDFELPPVKSKTATFPTIALDARVLAAATGSPFDGATIDVYVVRGETKLYVASAVTAADGRARADVFAAEHYLVYVSGKPDPKTLKYPWKLVTLRLEPRDGVLRVDARLERQE